MKSQVGGTADSVSPLSKYYTHVLQDLMPYVLCCKLEILSCDSYVKGRPEGCETDYRLPLPGNLDHYKPSIFLHNGDYFSWVSSEPCLIIFSTSHPGLELRIIKCSCRKA